MAVSELSHFESRVWGCLLGGTVGDAIGKATHRLSRDEIQSRFGYVTGLIDTIAPPCNVNPSAPVVSAASWRSMPEEPVPVPGGQYTDVTRLKHLLCDAMIFFGGHVGAYEVSKYWLEHMNPFDYYYPVFASFFKLYFDAAPPRDNGIGNIPSNSSAMAIAPVGLINPAQPRNAALEAFDVASLVHTGYARDAACLVAAGVAACLAPDATTESVVEAAREAVHPDQVLCEAMDKALEVAEEATSEEDLIERLYGSALWPLIRREANPLDPGYMPTADPREAVPCAFAMYSFAGGDPTRALLCAANFGRDALAIGSIVGSLAGALSGVEAIPDDWRQRVEGANPRTDLNLVRGLIAIVERDIAFSAQRAQFLQSMGLGSAR